MGKNNKQVNLKSLRASIRKLKEEDTDGLWTVRARKLCCEAFVDMPKSKMIKIANEMPTDSLFIQDLMASVTSAGYAVRENRGDDVFIARIAEELAELSVALMKSIRGTADIDNIKEEIADVENVVEWARQIYNLEADPVISKLRYMKMYKELARMDMVPDRDITRSHFVESTDSEKK